MNWSIVNGIIVGRDGDKLVYPSASDLFTINSGNIVVSGCNYKFNLEDLLFSKLLSKKFFVCFDISNEIITCDVFTNHQGDVFKVSLLPNGEFSDYIIINKRCYYLDFHISDLNKLFRELNINVCNGLSYLNYIKLLKAFSEQNFEYIDNVKDLTGKIKASNKNLIIRGFNGKLFNYQAIGVKWLTYMVKSGCGCILADEMGLGKTLQIILTIAYEYERDNSKKFLVVAPVSLLENWKREFNKFYNSIKCLVHHGNYRFSSYKDFSDYNVIITSYGNVQTDLALFEMINWHLVVLDEAQNIKNPRAKRTKLIKAIPKDVGIAVTGTPFENHLTDIWSLTDFVTPNYLGDLNQFNKVFNDNEESAELIEQYLTPIMIRRKVHEVAKDLPSKIIIPQVLLMDETEASLYEKGRSSIEDMKKLQLSNIQQLRMFCSHPSVYNDEYKDCDPVLISTKYKRCCELVEEIVKNKDKVLIFTSFNAMIKLLHDDLNTRFNVPTYFINGSVNTDLRQLIIDEFQAVNDAAIMILNPKAAGAGLNITCANHVIHYNLEWNPSVEDQASARSYRRGQTKTVFIYRLFYKNTIEEIINERIERKRNLSDVVVVGNQGEVEANDLIKAFTISPIKGVR